MDVIAWKGQGAPSLNRGHVSTPQNHMRHHYAIIVLSYTSVFPLFYTEHLPGFLFLIDHMLILLLVGTTYTYHGAFQKKNNFVRIRLHSFIISSHALLVELRSIKNLHCSTGRAFACKCNGCNFEFHQNAMGFCATLW